MKIFDNIWQYVKLYIGDIVWWFMIIYPCIWQEKLQKFIYLKSNKIKIYIYIFTVVSFQNKTLIVIIFYLYKNKI